MLAERLNVGVLPQRRGVALGFGVRGLTTLRFARCDVESLLCLGAEFLVGGLAPGTSPVVLLLPGLLSAGLASGADRVLRRLGDPVAEIAAGHSAVEARALIADRIDLKSAR